MRAVIVYGGPKVFAAGADVKEMASHAPTPTWPPSPAACPPGSGRSPEIPKPTVAAITGYALGGGLEVALACDRRIAADNAKLGVPEILLGVIPGGGGTQRLARLIGPARAKDLVYTGRFVHAEEALAIGLVDEVVPADDVYARARAYVEPFTRGPALAYAAAKKAIDGGLDVDLRTGLDIESDLFAAPLRDRRPPHRDGVVRRGRAGQGAVHRALRNRGEPDRPTSRGTGDGTGDAWRHPAR